MPIYEIKNPAPLPLLSEPAERKTEPITAVQPILRIRHLKREWQRRRYPPPGEEASAEGGRPLVAARQLLERFNSDLKRHGIGLHLGLRREEEGLLLEIHDCTDGRVCALFHDREISLEELPALLHHLQTETGIVIDTTI